MTDASIVSCIVAVHESRMHLLTRDGALPRGDLDLSKGIEHPVWATLHDALVLGTAQRDVVKSIQDDDLPAMLVPVDSSSARLTTLLGAMGITAVTLESASETVLRTARSHRVVVVSEHAQDFPEPWDRQVHGIELAGLPDPVQLPARVADDALVIPYLVVVPYQDTASPEYRWVPVAEIEEAADGAIASSAIDSLGELMETTSIATGLLGTAFTLGELHRVYEDIWGVILDRSNFQRKLLSVQGFLVDAGSEGARWPRRSPTARVYRRGPLDAQLRPPLYRP